MRNSFGSWQRLARYGIAHGSYANAAKLLAENPVLARMKELEALTEILDGAKTTFIFGQGDVTEQVRRLVAEDRQDN